MHISENTDLGRALLGGLIVGSSSAAFMYLSGRITGLSGIAKGMVRPEGEDWQVTYNLGLASAGFLAHHFAPQLVPVETATQSIPVIISAGLLVGYGTRLAGGCTSGHGLCGLSRFSPRSLVAVLTFMASGAVTSTIVHLPSIQPLLVSPSPVVFPNLVSALVPTLSVLAMAQAYNRADNAKSPTPAVSSSLLAHATAFGCALLFGAGLLVGQMVDTTKVLSFLDFLSTTRGWDPSLAGVMGGGLLVTAIAFPMMKNSCCSTIVDGKKLSSVINYGPCGPNMVIDGKLLLGSTLFGIGWGLLGVCPGPGLVNLGAGSAVSALFIPSMFFGMMLRPKNFW